MQTTNEEAIQRCMKWINNWITPQEKINTQHIAYELKHVVEGWNEWKGTSNYVSSGDFVEAATRLGYKVNCPSGAPENAYFNMSFKDAERDSLMSNMDRRTVKVSPENVEICKNWMEIWVVPRKTINPDATIDNLIDYIGSITPKPLDYGDICCAAKTLGYRYAKRRVDHFNREYCFNMKLPNREIRMKMSLVTYRRTLK